MDTKDKKMVKADVDAITKVMERAWDKIKDSYPDKLSLFMDLHATHTNGCPLDFNKLLSFDDFDFYHDILGIRKNLNRDTKKLENVFLPRCAVPNAVSGYTCNKCGFSVGWEDFYADSELNPKRKCPIKGCSGTMKADSH